MSQGTSVTGVTVCKYQCKLSRKLCKCHSVQASQCPSVTGYKCYSVQAAFSVLSSFTAMSYLDQGEVSDVNHGYEEVIGYP